MVVEEVMNAHVVTCTPSSTLASASASMRDNACGFLPVVDTRGAVVGVVTDRDVCLAETAERIPTRIEVSEVMSHPVYGCFPDEDLRMALGTMVKHHVRRLAVLDREHGHIQGILSIDDVVLAPRHRGTPTNDEIVEAFRTIVARPPVEPARAS